jgi:hypothetical protein
MPPVGFESTISAGERPKTYALDRAATGTGTICNIHLLILKFSHNQSVLLPCEYPDDGGGGGQHPNKSD